MANWATTSYKIEDKEENLLELFELIKAFDSKERPPMEENASEGWEGNIILALGIEKGKAYLRGFINEYSLENGVLSIVAEEAWGATDFRRLLVKHYDGMKVFYSVEEEGNAIYETNDVEGKYFKFRFSVHTCIEGSDEYEDFITEKEALEYIASLLKRKSITKEEIEEWNEEQEDEDDNYIDFHEYEIVE